MIEGHKNIKVSVIIPVYNRENLIVRCLNSAVNQTLDDIEVIIVDDGSVDNSYSICENYQKKYKDRVYLYRNSGKGAASARNYGITKAHGQYITFLDSDDYIEYDAFQRMYECAILNNSDMVCAPLYYVDNYRCRVVGRANIEYGNNRDFIAKATSNLYNKLIEKSLIDSLGIEIPEFTLGEDTAFITVLLSWAKNLVYEDYPYYYYELSENSLSKPIDRPWIVDNISSVENYLFQNANPEFYDMVSLVLTRRFLHLYNQNKNYQDILQAYAYDKRYTYLYNIPDEFRVEINRIREIIWLQPEKIPSTIILNGFGKNITQEQIDAYTNTAFRADTCVLILNENNCDMDACPNVHVAMMNNDFSYLGHFFAIKYIYENGGIYLSQDLKILKQLNELKNCKAFFSYQSKGSFSDKIYGGVSGCIIFKQLLDEMIAVPYTNALFIEIMSYVLRTNLNFNMNNFTEKTADNIWIYPSSMFHVPRYNVPCLTKQMFLERHENYIPESVQLQQSKEDYEKYNSLKIKYDGQLRELRELRRRYSIIEQYYADVMHSVSFKMGRCITYVPRKLRGGVRCMIDHGVLYTIVYSYQKLMRRLPE